MDVPIPNPADLVSNPVDDTVPDWQLAEVERRKANLAANPGTVLTWEEIVRRVRSGDGN